MRRTLVWGGLLGVTCLSASVADLTFEWSAEAPNGVFPASEIHYLGLKEGALAFGGYPTRFGSPVHWGALQSLSSKGRVHELDDGAVALISFQIPSGVVLRFHAPKLSPIPFAGRKRGFDGEWAARLSLWFCALVLAVGIAIRRRLRTEPK